jgi:hypothetical protein
MEYMGEQQSKSAVRYFRPAFVFLLVCALWGVRIPLVQAYYERTLHLGYYPPEADSIGIPIAGEAITTFVLFPVLVACLTLILRRFPTPCSWLAWSKRQWVWSAFWTLLCGLLIYQTADFLMDNLHLGLQRNALANAGWMLVWVELRAVIVSKLMP